MDYRDPFSGRYYGIWNVEGSGDPLLLSRDKLSLEQELKRRQALPDDDDDQLTEWHQIFPCDLFGAWWNSWDPDPREGSPLSVTEVVKVHLPVVEQQLAAAEERLQKVSSQSWWQRTSVVLGAGGVALGGFGFFTSNYYVAFAGAVLFLLGAFKVEVTLG